MNDVDISKGVTVRSFGFNVPCRQFIIGAQITRDRRMPMVDEFVLRTLKLCERVPVSRLMSYFGFSQMEMETVLTDLAARGLTVVEGEHVLLHSSALEMFRTSPDGGPTIMEVEGWVERLWFDLISQNMIAPDGLRRGRNLLELKPPGNKRTLPAEFAREAFHTNFRDYLRLVRRINNPENISLYAITDVEAGKFGFIPIEGKEELVYDPQPKLKPTLLEAAKDRPQRLRLLTDAMSQALEGLTEPGSSANARAEYSQLTGSEFLTIGQNGYLDLRRWIEDEQLKESEDEFAFVGSLYLERNRKAFCDVLSRAAPFDAFNDSAAIELLWFRPGGSAWGTTDDLRAMLGDVRSVVRKSASSTDRVIATSLIVPAAARNDRPKRFDRLFNRALLAPPGLISPALEVVILRGLGAAVSTIVPLSEKVSIWIGRATARPGDVARIEQRIRWAEINRTPQLIWGENKLLGGEDSEQLSELE